MLVAALADLGSAITRAVTCSDVINQISTACANHPALASAIKSYLVDQTLLAPAVSYHLALNVTEPLANCARAPNDILQAALDNAEHHSHEP